MMSSRRPPAVTLVDVLEKWAEIRPAATAYSVPRAGGDTLTSISYSGLGQRVREIAAGIGERVAAGERVLIMMPNGIDFMLAYLACLAAGVVAVPVPQPQRNNARLQGIIADCGAIAAIVENADRAREHAQDLAAGPAVPQWLSLDEIAAPEVIGSLRRPSARSLAMLQYTSGSTASPKGVRLTHANLLHNQGMIDAVFGLGDGDVVLGWLPLFHDMGLMGIALHPIYKGIQGILLRPESFVRRPLSWLDSISRYGATVSGAPDFAYRLCARLAGEIDLSQLDLSHWRVAFSGSERVRSQTLTRFAAAFADSGFRPNAFLPCYGMAEATLMISGCPPQTTPVVRQVEAQALHSRQCALAPRPGDQVIDLVGVGSPMPGQTLAVVDPADHRRLPDREVGEIWVAGASVSEGYWGSAESSRVRPSWDAGLDYLRTGDLGFLDDGELFVTGRLKDLIILGGRNLHAEDIEIVAERCLADETVAGGVIAYAVESDDQERLVVAFEVNSRRSPDVETLAGTVRRELARAFEVELHALTAVRRGGLPRTSSHKPRRGHASRLWSLGQLPVLAQAFPGSELEISAILPGRAALAQATEQGAGGLLAEALAGWIRRLGGLEGIPDPQVRSSSLPELGLASRQIIDLLHGIHSQYGIELALGDSLEAASLETFAELIVSRLRMALSTVHGEARGVDGDTRRSWAPLTLGQEGIWFAQQLGSPGEAHRLARAAEIRPAVDIGAMDRALAELVDRHAVLQLAIEPPAEDRMATQRIVAGSTVRTRLIVCSSPAERAQTLRAEADAPFDLTAPPLLRVSVLRTPTCRDVLVLTAHHIICDLWSLSVLMQDLMSGYRRALAGTSANLPVPDADESYLAHAWTERERAGDEEWRRRADHWQQRLGAVENAGTEDSGPMPSGSDSSTVAHQRVGRIGPEATRRLRRLAGRHGMSLQMVLFAAFQWAAWVVEGRDGFLACSVTGGRDRAERRRTVGYFANLLPFRVSVSRRDSIAQWLERIRREMLDAYANELPYEEIVRADTQRQGRGWAAGYVFALQDEGAAGDPGFVPFALGQAGGCWETGGIELWSLEFEESQSQFPLVLYAGLDGEGISLRYKAAAPLMSSARLATSAQLVERIVAWLVEEEADERRLSEVDWLDAAQRRQLHKLVSEVAGQRDTHLLEGFEAQHRRTPDRIALEFEGQQISYACLYARVLRMAAALQARGVGRDTVVGVCLTRSIDLVVVLYGVLKAGGAYLPLDPEHPAGYLRTLVSEAGVRRLVSDAAGQEKLSEALPDGEIIDVASAIRTQQPPASEFPAPDPGQLAYVIFTSGSTGTPKAAMNTHAGIVNRLAWMQDRYQLNAADTLLQKTPVGFDVSVWELFWPLMAGARLVIARPGGHKDPGYLAELLTDAMVTVVHFVPSMLRMFLLADGGVGCQALRTVICSGEALPTELAREAAERFPSTVDNLYGPTEAAVDVTWYSCVSDWPGVVQPIGQGIDNIRLHVLDPALRALPGQVAGDLFISGVGVGRGYLHRPRLTAERFRPDPLGADGARCYDTGDRARFLRADLIEYLGRRDGQVKLRGLRVELAEIEAVLERHPSIAAAAAAVSNYVVDAAPLHYLDRGPADPSWQPPSDHRVFLQGELVRAGRAEPAARLVAYCVVKDGAELDVESVQAWVRDRLPEQSVPAAVVFLESLPVTANGKLDRTGLPAPDTLRPSLAAAYRAPGSAGELSLAGVWERVLGVRGIGVSDNFFALGGDSIRALGVIAAAARAGIVFDLATLFAHPTIAELARATATTTTGPSPQPGIAPFALVSDADRGRLPDGIVDAYPLAAVQAGLIFHEEAAPGTPVYKDVFVYRIQAPFDEDLFREAVGASVQRHEILRTSIDLEGFSVPLQLVHADAVAAIEVRRADEALDEADLRAFVERQRARVFDWNRPPFLRFSIIVRPEAGFDLFVVFHDLLLDGWSASQLVTELLLAYDGLLANGELGILPELRIRFADYVAAEREAARSSQAHEFFDRFLAEPPGHRFPIRPSERSILPRFAVLEVPVALDVSQRLNRAAVDCGVGVKHVLLAAHMAVLAQVFGERDVVTGLESNGRLESEGGDKVLGMHLNTVPFRIGRVTGRWRDLVTETYRTEQALLPVRRYPYANLQRTRGTGDLVDTVFNYVHFHGFLELTRLRRLQVLEARGYGASHFKYRSEFSTDPFSGRIRLCLEYDAEALPSGLAREIGNYFAAVLTAMAEDLDAPCEQPPMVRKRRRLPRPEQAGAAGVWLDRWQERLNGNSDDIAVVHGARRVSAAALWLRALAWAGALARRGVTGEGRVGILLHDPIDHSTAVLAVQLAGGAYVPLHPRSPLARNATVLASSRTTHAIVDDVEAVDGGAGIRLLQPRDLDGDPGGPSLPAIDPDQLSYVIYTSGSSGTPKGVMVSHGNLWSSLKSRSEYYGLVGAKSFLMIPSFAFDSSVGVFYWALADGHRLVFPAADVSDLHSVLATLREERITHMLCTPSYYAALLEEAGASESAGADLRSLEAVIVAGEPLPRPLIERHFSQQPATALFNEYGPTEGTVWTSVHRCHGGAEDSTVGSPHSAARVRILDRRRLPAMPGQSGELLIGGTGIARGYLGSPVATAAAFVPDADPRAAGGSRAYASGDRARMDTDGVITLLGREDRQIKVNGYRVEPEEIEHAILTLPGMLQCALVAMPRSQGGGTLLTAFVVPAGRSTPDLRRLAEILPAYMMPNRVLSLGALPLNANNKVDYGLLRRHGEQLSGEWQAQRIVDEVERMSEEDVLAALDRAARELSEGRPHHDSAG
ncbi:hypothetical protein GCM10009745_41020 [Kribbella yunnanensis]|uniref:Carrier domain-containing protein n=1 Tax=Kribbella yunnanensis TaxID=190194 RepID=A0ABN2HPV7_9ACTN